MAAVGRPARRSKLVRSCLVELLSRMGVVVGSRGKCLPRSDDEGEDTEHGEQVKTILLPVEPELQRLARLLPPLLSASSQVDTTRKECAIRIKCLDVEGVEGFVDSVWERLSARSSKTVTLGQTRTPPHVQDELFLQATFHGDRDCKGDRVEPPRFIDPCCGSGVLLGARVKRECTRFSACASSYAGLLEALSRLVIATVGIDVDLTSCILSRFRVICCMVPALVDAFTTADDLNDGEEDGGDKKSVRKAIPYLQIYHGDSLLLYEEGHKLQQTLVSGQLSFVRSMDTSKDSQQLNFGRFDVVLLNPPYRNLIRDSMHHKQPSFKTAVQVTTGPWTNFRHHNAYGYFLELGFALLRPLGILCAAVLRNFVDLVKYPQDAKFHVDLIERFERAATPSRILLLQGNACSGLPYDFVKDAKKGIEMAVLSFCAGGAHGKFEARRQSESRTEPSTGKSSWLRILKSFLQVHVEVSIISTPHQKQPVMDKVSIQDLWSNGLGCIDPMLIQKYGPSMCRRVFSLRWRRLVKRLRDDKGQGALRCAGPGLEDRSCIITLARSHVVLQQLEDACQKQKVWKGKDEVEKKESEASDWMGRTALHRCARYGRLMKGQFLLEVQGAQTGMLDAHKRSALHEAVRSGQVAFVELLVKHVVDRASRRRCAAAALAFLNAQDENGLSALDYCTFGGVTSDANEIAARFIRKAVVVLDGLTGRQKVTVISGNGEHCGEKGGTEIAARLDLPRLSRPFRAAQQDRGTLMAYNRVLMESRKKKGNSLRPWPWLSEAVTYADEEHEVFCLRGCHVFESLLSPRALLFAQRRASEIWSACVPGVDKRRLYHLHECGEPWIFELASSPALVEIARKHCASQSVYLTQSHLVCKEPGSDYEIPWHQDYRSGHEIGRMIIWIALDDTNEKNGCVHVLPGWHRLGVLPVHDLGYADFASVIEPFALPTEATCGAFAVPLVMGAGQAWVCHPLIPHMSKGNKTTSWRRGLVLRYSAPTAEELRGGLPSCSTCTDSIGIDYRSGMMYNGKRWLVGS